MKTDKEPRVNASSIRYSNSVLEIINKAEGNVSKVMQIQR